MIGKSRTAPALMGLLAVVLTAMLMIAGPALAGHGGGHGQSDGHGQSGQAHGNQGSNADNGGQGNSGGSGGGQSGGGSQSGGAGQGSGGWGSRGPDREPAGGGGGNDAPKDNDGDADNDPNTEYTEDNDNDGRANNDDPTPSRHPSGKDKYIEPGGSGNQGKSESDPDGMSNGGADKPNGTGGEDIYDQDGNNGCGNDQDFEDDNNGNCGGKKKPKPEAEQVQVEAAAATVTCPANAAGMTTGVCGVSVAAADFAIASAASPATIEVSGDAATVEEAPAVLGSRIERPATKPETLVAPATLASKLAGGILPFTGTDLKVIVGIGLVLILAGLLISRRRAAAE